MVLLYHGNVLDKDETLAQCGVSGGDFLNVSRRAIRRSPYYEDPMTHQPQRITVIYTSGEQMTLELDLNQPVSVLIQRCAEQWHCDPCGIVLTRGGKILDKNQTLSYYGIQKNDRITGAGRVHGG